MLVLAPIEGASRSRPSGSALWGIEFQTQVAHVHLAASSARTGSVWGTARLSRPPTRGPCACCPSLWLQAGGRASQRENPDSDSDYKSGREGGSDDDLLEHQARYCHAVLRCAMLCCGRCGLLAVMRRAVVTVFARAAAALCAAAPCCVRRAVAKTLSSTSCLRIAFLALQTISSDLVQ